MNRFVHSRLSIHVAERFWLAVIFVLGASLRLYGLEIQSLWQDEGLQYYLATHNTIDELFRQRLSFHPPLSFVVNHFFLLFGESDFLLRLPSALFGIASLPVLYALARDTTSRPVAAYSVFFLALSPFHLWYSQEGRMYSQLMFLSLLSSVLLLQALRRGKASCWIYYIAVSTAGIYTHVFMALTLAAHFLWILVYRRRQLLPMMASDLAVALLFLPWVLLLPWVTGFARHVSASGLAMGLASDGRAGFTWAAVPYTLFTYAAGFSLGPSVAELHADKSIASILSFLPSIGIVMSVFLVLLSIGVWRIIKSVGWQKGMFCFLGLLIPVVGTAIYSVTPRATFNVRYTVIAFPFFCLLIGTALAFLNHANKVFGTLAILAVVGISAASTYNHFTNARYAKEDVKSAVAFWEQTAGDELLLAVGSIAPVQRYVAASDASRLFLIGTSSNEIVPRIERVFLKQNTSSAYIVVARDWDKSSEKAIVNTFAGTLERSFSGAKVFRIFRPRTFEFSDGAAKLAASHQR